MSARSARAEVVVPVDPATAFELFTDRIDDWWEPGPINYFDASRAVAMRIEPGVGGRVLEDYGDDTPLVLAEILEWVPGERLVLRGVVDDSEAEITLSRSPPARVWRCTTSCGPVVSRRSCSGPT